MKNASIRSRLVFTFSILVFMPLSISAAGFYAAHRSAAAFVPIAIVSAIVVCAAIILSVRAMRAMVGPLRRLADSADELAAGRTDAAIIDIDRADEIGGLARGLDQWRQHLIAATEREALERAEMARGEARQRKIEDAARRFDQNIVAIMGTIKKVVGHLHESADALSANAEQTQTQSTTVTNVTEQATENLAVMSAASNELMASIQEISRQAQQSAETTKKAAHDADDTFRKITGLAEAAQKIGEIVGMINRIAAMTNLLALNATIESARAKEEGKGFAVVAHEVKNLAGQTSHATEDIAQQVEAIQEETKSAVEAIQAINLTVGSLDEMATAIAGAAEQQAAATAEIARNSEQASAGTREVTANIAGVSQGAAKTIQMAHDMFQVANDLLAESGRLEQETERFLTEARSAVARQTPLSIPEGAKLVHAADARRLQTEGAIIVDTRIASEYAEIHITGAVSIPYGEHSDRSVDFDPSVDDFDLGRLPPDRSVPVVFYCNGGQCWKAYKAAILAARAGYTNAYWFRDGVPAWMAEGFSVD